MKHSNLKMGDYMNIDDQQDEYALDNLIIFVICAVIGTFFILIICFSCYHFWRPLKAWNVSSREHSSDNFNSTQHPSMDTGHSYLCKHVTCDYTFTCLNMQKIRLIIGLIWKLLNLLMGICRHF